MTRLTNKLPELTRTPRSPVGHPFHLTFAISTLFSSFPLHANPPHYSQRQLGRTESRGILVRPVDWFTPSTVQNTRACPPLTLNVLPLVRELRDNPRMISLM